LWQRSTNYFRFTIIADGITLREMPYTRYGSARFEVFGFVFGVVGNLNSAVVLYPVETFFHNNFPLQALIELIKKTLYELSHTGKEVVDWVWCRVPPGDSVPDHRAALLTCLPGRPTA